MLDTVNGTSLQNGTLGIGELHLQQPCELSECVANTEPHLTPPALAPKTKASGAPLHA